MEEVSIRLPIRLVPRQGSNFIPILVMILAAAILLWWAANRVGQIWGDGARAATGADYFYIFFALAFACWVVARTLRAFRRISLGSPEHYLEVSSGGITVRTGQRKQAFPWASLSAFDAVARMRISDPIYYEHYVVALPASVDGAPTDLQERYRRAHLRIAVSDFGHDDDAANAEDLAAWLNTLRDLALNHLLRADSEISIPPSLLHAISSLPDISHSHPNAVA
jgi:hypothetical protein